MFQIMRPPFSSLNPNTPVNIYPLKTHKNPSQFHAPSLKTSFSNHPITSKTHNLDLARKVFDEMSQPNLHTWNTIFKSYVENEMSQECLVMFAKFMSSSGLVPDGFGLRLVVKACGRIKGVKEGGMVHGLVLKFGFGLDLFVLSSLVSMYAKFGDVGSARRVFDGMGEKERDVVTWNALLDGYVKCGEVDVAKELFDEMGVKDVVSWTVMVDGLAKSGRVDEARRVFDEMPFRNVASWNVMINGYMKAGDLVSARSLFDQMGEKNIITWNTMIAGYESNGKGAEAVKLFTKLLNLGYVPTHSTLVSTLSAISSLALLSKGTWVHSYMIKNGHRLDNVLGTSLIEMYSKCSSIESALKVFETILNKKLGHWTAIIVGLGIHGLAKQALELFSKMLTLNIIPNAITFIGVLNACNHAGLVDDGRRYFDMMVNEYRIEPTIEHYGCLVDILCRAGCLEEAKNVIEKMPMKPNKIIWMSLLSASRIYKNVEIGEFAANHAREIDPKYIESYVLLSNMYAATGNWDKVSHVRETMKKTGVKKDPGCSMIEYKDEVHEFIVGDKSHPQTNEIYHKLSEIRERLKSAGHVPDKSQVLLHIDGDDAKEAELESHSERLAIAFGLINMKPGIPIRIVKNLRVCNDCHSVTKLLSKVYNREIIVRDNSRFHHFKNGSCSCMDYW
ncbi:pentatricopeptide repeat-containing protein [Tanacetum coccineum]